MSLIVAQDASIEGQKLRLMTRQPIVLPRPIKNEKLGKTTYPFRMGQNSEAEITEELNPKVAKIRETSVLDLGATLRAPKIYGFSTKPLPPWKLVQGTTNHKASEMRCRGFCFAEVDIPLTTVLNVTQRASPVVGASKP